MNIAVFNTGGTISCIGKPLAPMSANDFAVACKSIIEPILLQNFSDITISYIVPVKGGIGWFPESTTGTLDSTDIQPTDWCIIAECILDTYNNYDGWVILHGTDSMDFTGTALPFLLSSFSANGILKAQLSKPIILTGSQVPLFYQENADAPLTINYNTDAFQNFCGAIAAARTSIPEVCLYFHNKLYRACRCVKTNASKFNAFSSPNYPALGEYGINLSINQKTILAPPVNLDISLDNPIVIDNILKQLLHVKENINNFPTIIFNAFPAYYNYKSNTGLLSELINACVQKNIKGLILESYGEGNFPSGCPDNPRNGTIYNALKQANDNGVIIVDSTQVLKGMVNDSAYATGAWLPEVGVISAADITPISALVKLMILMSLADYHLNNWSNLQVKNLLQMNLIGEMNDINLLDSRTKNQLLVNEYITALDGSCILKNDSVLGPVFMGITKNYTKILWQAFTNNTPLTSKMPGKLIMQNDGNLIFYSRDEEVLWASDTGKGSYTPSRLSIEGSYNQNTAVLQVYNYSNNQESITLYKQ